MAPTKRASEILRVMWLAFEPTPGRPFNKLDLHLLRRSVDAMYKAAKSGAASATNPSFVEMVKAVAANAPTTEQGSNVEQFLLRQVDSGDLPILNEADGRLRVYDPGHNFRGLAR